MNNKELILLFRATLSIFILLMLFRIVPYFQNLLNLLVELFKLTETTPEFKIILVCISLWVTLSIMSFIVNTVFKLAAAVENKIIESKQNKNILTENFKKLLKRHTKKHQDSIIKVNSKRSMSKSDLIKIMDFVNKTSRRKNK